MRAFRFPLALAAPLLLIAETGRTETPGADASFPTPLAPPARSDSPRSGGASAPESTGSSTASQPAPTLPPGPARATATAPAAAVTAIAHTGGGDTTDTNSPPPNSAAIAPPANPGASSPGASSPALSSSAVSGPPLSSPAVPGPPPSRSAALGPPAPPSLRDALKAAPLSGAGRAHYRSIIERETARTGLPAEIAEAVMAVESGFNPAVIGAAGEIGLMQLMPPTARMMGFAGSLTDLAQPEVNIHYGVTYLSQAWRLAGGDLCTAVMKYRAGHGETRFSQLSVNYCLAVRSKLAARGYPVIGSVPVATFGELTRPFIRTSFGAPAGGGPLVGPPRLSLRGSPPPCRSHCLSEQVGGHPNFDRINDSLNQLVLQSNVRAIRVH